MTRTLILSESRARRTLDRLASQVVERNQGAERLDVFGIRNRGAALAATLAARIGTLEGIEVPYFSLDVGSFRDDRPRSSTPAQSDGPDITDRDVLLVDDVLYTGRTARAALDALLQFGRPRTIQFAVLVDRGHREYPIQPDYVGRVLPTKHRERVVVEIEAGFRVYVEE